MFYTVVFNLIWWLFVNSGVPSLQQAAASMSPVQCMEMSWDDSGRFTGQAVSMDHCE